MKIEFTIEGRLPDLNNYINAERSNRFLAAKIKKEATGVVAWQVKRIKKITEPGDYYFHWVVKDKRKDPDNIAWACKFILDGLQEAGKLDNDNMQMIKSIHHSFSIGNPKVVISILV